MVNTPRTSAQQQLLSQQALRLLEEAKNENRMLEENVATLKEQVSAMYACALKSMLFPTNTDEELTIFTSRLIYSSKRLSRSESSLESESPTTRKRFPSLKIKSKIERLRPSRRTLS